jgi:hypothetical protein
MTKPPLTKMDVLVLEGLARGLSGLKSEVPHVIAATEDGSVAMVCFPNDGLSFADYMRDLAVRLEANLGAEERRRIV